VSSVLYASFRQNGRKKGGGKGGGRGRQVLLASLSEEAKEKKKKRKGKRGSISTSKGMGRGPPSEFSFCNHGREKKKKKKEEEGKIERGKGRISPHHAHEFQKLEKRGTECRGEQGGESALMLGQALLAVQAKKKRGREDPVRGEGKRGGKGRPTQCALYDTALPAVRKKKRKKRRGY